jgi:hypothetical protein
MAKPLQPIWSLLALFLALPGDVQQLAIKNYQLWRHDPHHPSLRCRRAQGSSDRFSWHRPEPEPDSYVPAACAAGISREPRAYFKVNFAVVVFVTEPETPVKVIV